MEFFNAHWLAVGLSAIVLSCFLGMILQMFIRCDRKGNPILDESDDLEEIHNLECRSCELHAKIKALQELSDVPVYRYVEFKGELAKVIYRLNVAKTALEEKRKKAAGQNPTA